MPKNPTVNQSLESILAAVRRLRTLTDNDSTQLDADRELRTSVAGSDRSLWDLVERAETRHPVVTYRVVGYADGLIWTGTGRSRAEKVAAAAAAYTRRHFYLCDGGPTVENVLPPRAARTARIMRATGAL